MNDFGELWREIEDPQTVTLTVPATRTSPPLTVQVPYALIRQTSQEDVVGSDPTMDGHYLTVHCWEANLNGLTPMTGATLNDGTHSYEVKEVSHDNRRQRFKLTCLRIPS